MVPQGPPAPLGGGQPAPPSLLRSNSGMTSQNAFPSLVSPSNQFNNNMNMLGNAPNVSSLLHQSFGNGPPSSGSSQRGLIIDGGAESDPLSNVGSGMGFNHPSSSYMSSSISANPNLSGQVQGQQQLDPQNFQHNNQTQFSVPGNPQQTQQQFQGMRGGGLGGVGPVKMEPQGTNEHLRNLGPMKLEPQQLQSMRSVGPIKMEPQHSESSLFLHQLQQQQQQQQQLQSMRQSSQAAAAAQILHQQRLMQIQQQQQQQQLLKSMPQQRSPLPQQNLPIRSPVKPVYEPGMCARRLTHYMYQQQHRPEDNNIEFWRKFVAEYFAPNAKKKWCVSMYGSGRQTNGVFPQDVWHCEICNRKPGRGFEATFEVLPRLFKIKYESGTLEELLYVDMPREYQNSSGQIVLDYAKAIQESVFDQLRVVRDGQLRIVFSPDLKICSWEFCARRHEELIPRRLLIPQVSQLGAAAQKCQAATQNASASISASELQNNCNMFVASARQLAKALEVPLVNDLGYTKRYVRCLQISEVVNSMKDLIDYSRETGTGPMESLIKFPQRTNPSPRFQGQSQQTEGQQQQQNQAMGQNSNNENPAQSASTQFASNKNMPSVHNTQNSVPATSSTNNTIGGLLHQNSINSRHQNGPYGGTSVQMPSLSSSNTMPQTQPSSSNNNNNNPQPASHGSLSGTHANSLNISIPQQTSLYGDTDANDSQSSVQKIIQDMLISSQLGDMKNMNGGNILVGNGSANGNHGIGGLGFGSMGQSAMANGIRAALGSNNNNNSNSNSNSVLSMNGRVGMSRDLGNQLLGGLGAVNGCNDFQFDWKGSP